jgi:glycerol kinase
LLYDIRELSWSDELCDLFGVPRTVLPDVLPSCGRFGVVRGPLGAGAPALAGVPVSGVAGDQQAALFGQACVMRGMVKVTYGTGSFVLLNVGEEFPPPSEGLLTTVAWDLGEHGGSSPVAYALEGAVFVTGAAVQWLRDGLGLIEEASDIGALAARVGDSEGVFVVPAFTGLGSPWWDPYARGTITGITRGVGAAHIARAVVEAMAYQVRDVVDAMRNAGAEVAALRVDGGAAVLDMLLQMQADQLRVAVSRPTTTETTALGAATLAGLAEGVWASLDEIEALWSLQSQFTALATQVAADRAYAGWIQAVERSLGWAEPGS